MDLSPIFNDYKEHMKNIDLKFSSATKETDASSKEYPAISSSKESLTTTSLLSAPPQVSLDKKERESEVINTGKICYSAVHCLYL